MRERTGSKTSWFIASQDDSGTSCVGKAFSTFYSTLDIVYQPKHVTRLFTSFVHFTSPFRKYPSTAVFQRFIFKKKTTRVVTLTVLRWPTPRWFNVHTLQKLIYEIYYANTPTVNFLEEQNSSLSENKEICRKGCNYKRTLAWDFFVLIFCTYQTHIGQIMRLLSFFNFVLEFADLFKFVNIRWWLSWCRVSVLVNWVNAQWDSTSTESTRSETARQQSQRGMIKSS
jgi:hypothetical protein